MNRPEFYYSPWRHGGWYVENILYPSGAVGCIATIGPKKYAIACSDDPRRFTTRHDAAVAERELVDEKWREVLADPHRFEWMVAGQRVVVCTVHNDWHQVGQVSEGWPDRDDVGVEVVTQEPCEACTRRAPKRLLPRRAT